MLDLHRLRVFRAVVAAGSIQGAATNLGYTPSAVSQQVATLQRETGLTLVSRSGRGIEPTPAGLEVAALGGEVLASLDGVERRVRDLRESRAGSLSVAYFSSVGTAWMPSAVTALRQRFPDIRLELTIDELSPVRAEDPWDLRLIVSGPDFTPPAGIHSELLLTEPYVAAVPAGHRLADADEVDLAELATETWISNDNTEGWCYRQLLTACAAAGFQPRYTVEAAEHPTALAFVAIGAGITVLPELCVRTIPDGVALVGLRNPTPQRSIHAVTRDADNHPAVGTALEALRRAAGR